MKQLKTTACNAFNTEASDHVVNTFRLAGNPCHSFPREAVYVNALLYGEYNNHIDEGYIIDPWVDFDAEEFEGLG